MAKRIWWAILLLQHTRTFKPTRVSTLLSLLWRTSAWTSSDYEQIDLLWRKKPSCLIPLNSWFLRLSVRSELFVCGGKLPARQEHETEIRLTLSLQKQALQGLLIKLEQISSQMPWRLSRFNKNQFIITCRERRVKKCVVSFTREITSISFYLQ